MYSYKSIFCDASKIKERGLSDGDSRTMPGTRVFIRDRMLADDCYLPKPETHIFVFRPSRMPAPGMTQSADFPLVQFVYALRLLPIPKQIVIMESRYDGWEKDIEELTRPISDIQQATIVYDEVNNAGLLDSSLFVPIKEYAPAQYLYNSSGVIYTGDADELAWEDVSALYTDVAIAGGYRLRAALPLIDGDSSQDDMKEMFNAVFLGKAKMMDLYPHSETVRYKASLPRYRQLLEDGLVGGRFAFSTVMPAGAFAEHSQNLFHNAKMVEDAMDIWKYSVSGVPMIDTTNRDDLFGTPDFNIDHKKTFALGATLGVDKMLDAYLSGVPIDDILA